jgi:hypothetical protein
MKVPTLPLVLAGIVVGTIVFALVGTLIFRIKRGPAKKCEDAELGETLQAPSSPVSLSSPPASPLHHATEPSPCVTEEAAEPMHRPTPVQAAHAALWSRGGGA